MKSSLAHLLIASAVCVVTILCYGFWYATVGAKSAAVAQLESQISTKTETAGRIASARASLAGAADNEADIQGYFVPETGVVAFINNLEAQGRTQNASVSVLSVSTSVVDAQPTLTFSLTIRGAFDAVMRTIGVIEYLPYDLSVSTLSITRDGQDEKNSWRADLTLLVGSVKADVTTKTP